MKNTRITAPAISRNRCVRSRSREPRNDGMVIESPETWVYDRSRGAVTFQFSQAPMVSPTAIQPSIRPLA